MKSFESVQKESLDKIACSVGGNTLKRTITSFNSMHGMATRSNLDGRK